MNTPLDPSKAPGRKAKLPARCSLTLSAHFPVWVKLWVTPPDPLFDPHYFWRKQNKNSRNPPISGVSWSCYPDLNWRPHPYQLILHPRNASIRRFGGIFVPEKRRQWCFPLHCFRPLVSCCGSGCGSTAMCTPTVRPLEAADFCICLNPSATKAAEGFKK